MALQMDHRHFVKAPEAFFSQGDERALAGRAHRAGTGDVWADQGQGLDPGVCALVGNRAGRVGL